MHTPLFFLHLDIDFPGIFSSYAQLLKWRRPDIKLYGFCHAGSWNNKDIFENAKGKKEMELGTIKCFDKIFVATNYHKWNIERYFDKVFDNIVVVGLPFYPHDCLRQLEKPVLKSLLEKDIFLISGRPEQSDKSLIEKLKAKYNVNWVDFTSNYIKNSRKNYFEVLNHTRISVSFKVEETFGLSQFEVATFGGLILSPNKYSYPELILYPQLLYNNEEDLFEKFDKLFNLKANPYLINTHGYELSILSMVKEIYENR